jgi:hypothetical protein
LRLEGHAYSRRRGYRFAIDPPWLEPPLAKRLTGGVGESIALRLLGDNFGVPDRSIGFDRETEVNETGDVMLGGALGINQTAPANRSRVDNKGRLALRLGL